MFNLMQVQPQDSGVAHAPFTERRRDPRVRSVFRVGLVSSATDQGLCRIINISDHGAMLRSNVRPNLGDRLTVKLSDDIAVSGEVVWTSDTDCGVAFEDSVDCLDVLHRSYEASRAGGYRPHRLNIEQSARAYVDGSTIPVTVRNVSQRGMKISHSGSFTPGMRVKVRTQSGQERRGIVRWAEDGEAGLWLLDQYAPEELSSATLL